MGVEILILTRIQERYHFFHNYDNIHYSHNFKLNKYFYTFLQQYLKQKVRHNFVLLLTGVNIFLPLPRKIGKIRCMYKDFLEKYSIFKIQLGGLKKYHRVEIIYPCLFNDSYWWVHYNLNDISQANNVTYTGKLMFNV